jgi:hypothetical protein
LKTYADTSFVASLYVDDIHTSAATAIIAKALDPFLITPFVEVEVLNAVQLRVFRKHISVQQAQAATRSFELDIQAGAFSPQPVLAAAFDQAKRLALKYTSTLGIRSLDLMQVGSALALEAEAFASFDLAQRKLAHAAGLKLQPRILTHLT